MKASKECPNYLKEAGSIIALVLLGGYLPNKRTTLHVVSVVAQEQQPHHTMPASGTNSHKTAIREARHPKKVQSYAIRTMWHLSMKY